MKPGRVILYRLLVAMLLCGVAPAVCGQSAVERAIEALDAYDLDTAAELLDDYESRANRNRKTRLSAEQQAEVDGLRSRIVTLRNLLDRVERIEVFDSLTVDSADFFRHYRLSPAAGRLTAGTGRQADRAVMAYTPECGREMLWMAPDSSGTMTLMGASILDDGTVDEVTQLTVDPAQGGNVGYPFLMSDGISLYYASDGEGSIGGYDIFLTRRTDDGFTVPQNVGLPYNSPANDYLLAIDENTGVGWWATDRNAPEGKVTIYMFVPSETRVNYPSDRADLPDLAWLTDIKSTQPDGADYSALRRRLDEASAQTESNARPEQFRLTAGGRLYTRLEQLPDSRSRTAVTEMIAIERELNELTASLDALREQYRKGDRSLTNRILRDEQRQADLRRRLFDARNQAASLIR